MPEDGRREAAVEAEEAAALGEDLTGDEEEVGRTGWRGGGAEELETGLDGVHGEGGAFRERGGDGGQRQSGGHAIADANYAMAADAGTVSARPRRHSPKSEEWQCPVSTGEKEQLVELLLYPYWAEWRSISLLLCK